MIVGIFRQRHRGLIQHREVEGQIAVVEAETDLAGRHAQVVHHGAAGAFLDREHPGGAGVDIIGAELASVFGQHG